MSRSCKKVGVIKDHASASNFYNRIFRRVNKQRIRCGKEPLLMRELVDDYDVCDFKMWWGKRFRFGTLMENETKEQCKTRRRQYFKK